MTGRKRKDAPIGQLKDEDEDPPRKRRPQAKHRTLDESISVLEAYKNEHGHCKVPRTYKSDPALGAFVSRLRMKGPGGVTDEQRRRLDALDFDWEKQFDRQWNETYERLEDYRKKYGDCRVPTSWEDDRGLAIWVDTQRALYAKGRLRADRHKKLEAIKFTWRTQEHAARDTSFHDHRWLEMFRKLESFHRRHGHCMVPRLYEKDKALGRWVSVQREKFSLNDLSDDRKALLDDLGFVWRVDFDQRWAENYERLLAFIEQHGHCTVSIYAATTEDERKLANWVMHQRGLYNKGTLLPDRTAMLDQVGFAWNAVHLKSSTQRSKLLSSSSPLPAQLGVYSMDEERAIKKDHVAKLEEDVKIKKVEQEEVKEGEDEKMPAIPLLREPKYAVGTLVGKYFEGHGWYPGKVVSSDAYFYQIRYEDDDEEEFDDEEMKKYVML